jgi:Na+/proline symporter
MRRYLTPGWIVLTIVVALTCLYFLARVLDGAFRDAALGNLFATILGIIIGVPIAIELNRRQEEERTSRDNAVRSEAESLRARALY